MSPACAFLSSCTLVSEDGSFGLHNPRDVHTYAYKHPRQSQAILSAGCSRLINSVCLTRTRRILGPSTGTNLQSRVPVILVRLWRPWQPWRPVGHICWFNNQTLVATSSTTRTGDPYHDGPDQTAAWFRQSMMQVMAACTTVRADIPLFPGAGQADGSGAARHQHRIRRLPWC